MKLNRRQLRRLILKESQLLNEKDLMSNALKAAQAIVDLTGVSENREDLERDIQASLTEDEIKTLYKLVHKVYRNAGGN